jgi:hypothetical protein
VLSNDDVPDGGSRQEIEHSIGIGSLSLLVAAALHTLVTLHLSIERLTGVDVHGLVEHNSLLGDRELDTREREARCWSTTEITLCGIGTTLRPIALLVLAATKCSCRRQCRNERNDKSRGELHCDCRI